MKATNIVDGTECVVKVRSLDKGTHARLYNDGDMVRIEFLAPVKGSVANGQSGVFYVDGDIIGGGIITDHQ